MEWKKPDDYEFTEEASLLQENETVEKVVNDQTYLVLSFKLKDYRCKEITEWNQKYRSVLTTEVTVLSDGKKVVQEMKYDSGYPPDGMTVQTIAHRINGSLGQKLTLKAKRDNLFNMPVVEILTPPSVMSLIDIHFSYIIGKFSN